MKILSLVLGMCCCLVASASTSTDELAQPHRQSFACSMGGCTVSCPTTGQVPAIRFKANALSLTVLPNRVAVFDATSGFDSKRTYLVDLTERNCEIEQ
jgi:hypothetical protein